MKETKILIKTPFKRKFWCYVIPIAFLFTCIPFLLTSCMTIQESVTDPMRDNPRIVFRDLTKLPDSAIHDRPDQEKKESQITQTPETSNTEGE